MGRSEPLLRLFLQWGKMNFFGPGIPIFVSDIEVGLRMPEIKTLDAYYLFSPVVGVSIIGANEDEALLSLLVTDAPAFSEPQEWTDPVVGVQAIPEQLKDCPVSIIAVDMDVLTDTCPYWDDGIIGFTSTVKQESENIAFVIAETIDINKNYTVGLYGIKE